jgi:hypothetical protein
VICSLPRSFAKKRVQRTAKKEKGTSTKDKPTVSRLAQLTVSDRARNASPQKPHGNQAATHVLNWGPNQGFNLDPGAMTVGPTQSIRLFATSASSPTNCPSQPTWKRAGLRSRPGCQLTRSLACGYRALAEVDAMSAVPSLMQSRCAGS